ncbi:hypothetical protein K491DRAFT_678716 [Lophiostoma macrostomum CBS 122681]|uniref:Uncharacterized protein n=1 Tax=Lophiostoma macrostomum CBS 122681 TaxID=1314788 RepID=A0A6A6T9P1_9PLEO|nr:hypothetical protein K491DRAFT_678716 [Lophiostoma macrostomum CBS 122681]
MSTSSRYVHVWHNHCQSFGIPDNRPLGIFAIALGDKEVSVQRNSELQEALCRLETLGPDVAMTAIFQKGEQKVVMTITQRGEEIETRPEEVDGEGSDLQKIHEQLEPERKRRERTDVENILGQAKEQLKKAQQQVKTTHNQNEEARNQTEKAQKQMQEAQEQMQKTQNLMNAAQKNMKRAYEKMEKAQRRVLRKMARSGNNGTEGEESHSSSESEDESDSEDVSVEV